MKHNKQDLDRIIDDSDERYTRRANGFINHRAIRGARLGASQSTSENSLSANSYSGDFNTMNASNNNEQINGCADFQSLIPAYLDKQLSTARTLLLEDHTNECIPCRRELKAQRTSATATAPTYIRQPVKRARETATQCRRTDRRNAWSKSNVAALECRCSARHLFRIVGLFVSSVSTGPVRTLAATVENANGAVYVVSENAEPPARGGEQLTEGRKRTHGEGVACRAAHWQDAFDG
jgi:hypothetical protein